MIQKLTFSEAEAELDALTEILHAAVLDGASVNFMLPFTQDEARAFWTDSAFPAIASGSRLLFVARDGDGAAQGTVMLDLIGMPNQPHRAEITKMLVHPAARRQGLARALLVSAEAVARSLGRTVLTLDTWAGSEAEVLYRSVGYEFAGEIPDFFLHPVDGSLQPTRYFYKRLT